MDKPNYYAIIPAEVRYSKKLTPNAKLLYAEITALCNMNGKCTASTDYFCKLYEVSRVSIQKWLKILESNNHIKRVNIYKQGSKEILTRVITLVNNPCKEKLTDNTNININNINLTDSNNKGRFKKPTLERRDKDKPKSMSKIHQHLQKNINVKEKLKKQFENENNKNNVK